MIVRMKICTKGKADFSYNFLSDLKYGLHFATVATRWDPLAGGALEVQQKMHIRKQSEKNILQNHYSRLKNEEYLLITKIIQN